MLANLDYVNDLGPASDRRSTSGDTAKFADAHARALDAQAASAVDGHHERADRRAGTSSRAATARSAASSSARARADSCCSTPRIRVGSASDGDRGPSGGPVRLRPRRLGRAGPELTLQSTAARAGDASVDATEAAGAHASCHAGTRDSASLLAVVALLAVARGGSSYVVLMRDRPLFPDSLGYHFRAQLLADGEGFVVPARQILDAPSNPPMPAFRPCGRCSSRGRPSWDCGRSSPNSSVACLLGGATSFMTGLAGRAAFGRRAGLIAAAIVAVYPNVWIYERELLSEPLAMLGVATTIWLAYRFLANPTPPVGARRRRRRRAARVDEGGADRAAAVARRSAVPVATVAALRPSGGFVALAGVACVALIAPWTVYNATASNGRCPSRPARARRCEPGTATSPTAASSSATPP